MEIQNFHNRHFCRICAKENCEQCFSIFENSEMESSILTKIEAYLPIKVAFSDNLPDRICNSCLYKLNACHELVEIAKAADIKLRILFDELLHQQEPLANNECGIMNNSNIGVEEGQYYVNEENIPLIKNYEIENVDTRNEKILDEVNFTFEIANNIEPVETVETNNLGCTNDYIILNGDNSNIRTNDVFQIAEPVPDNKFGNVILSQNDDPYVLETLYVPQTINNENNEFSSFTENQEPDDPNLTYEEKPTYIAEEKPTYIVEEKPTYLDEENPTYLDEENSHNDIKINDKHICNRCGKVCKTAGGLDVHKSTHSKVASYLCDLCGKNFKHANSLKCHKRTHLDESLKKKHKCNICRKAFRSKFHLSEHMNVHNGVKPYSCQVCSKTFHRRIQLRQHATTHISDEDKVACSFCDMKFNRTSNLRAHVKKCHDENRTFKCRICSEEFRSVSQLLSHRKSHVQTENKVDDYKETFSGQGFSCNICGKTLLKKKSLEVHIQSHNGKNKCWCGICKKELSSKSSLRYHLKSFHSSERKWRCQFCDKGFMSQHLKLTHELIHTGIKPYSCSNCDKSFSSSKSLRQHSLKHSDERKFECHYCSKSFHRKSTLVIHLRTHTGEKPYKCDICGQRFSQKHDMKKHKKTHPSLVSDDVNNSTDVVLPKDEFYSCETCPSVFGSETELEKHKLITHEIVIPIVFSNQNADISSSINDLFVDNDDDVFITSL